MDDLVFIPMGTGSAFAARRLNSALLVCHVTDGLVDDTLLVDVGETASVSFRLLHLARATGRILDLASGRLEDFDAGSLPEGVPDTLDDVHNVVVTHTHGDHAAGLANYLLRHRFPADGRPRGPLPTVVAGDPVMARLWDGVLRGMLGTWTETPPPSLESVCQPVGLGPGDSWTWQGYTIRAIPTEHVPSPPGDPFPSHAIALANGSADRRLVWSGDTQLRPEQVKGSFEPYDVIFHDCQFGEDPTHASFEELARLPAGIREKMYLYHLTDAAEDYEEKARRLFRGFLEAHRAYRWSDLTSKLDVGG